MTLKDKEMIEYEGDAFMDMKLYNTWMTVTGLALGVIGLAFVLVSIFDSGASTLALMIGLLFIAAGNLLNVIRLRQKKKNQEG